MTEYETAALRAALGIQARLVEGRQNTVNLALPEAPWNECCRLARLIGIAEHRRWRHAAGRLHRHWLAAVDDFRNALSRILYQRQSAVDRPEPLRPLEIYREILSLHDDFDGVTCDLRERVLSVQTDDIVLEGLCFGRFEIRLEWETLGGEGWYSVVALDPRTATGNSETTHPHVQSERLCEGDGRAAIRRALAAGRLSDFFAIVDRILHTYNPDSAYVRLEQWEGTPCSDCAATVLEDEGYSCQSCHSTLCDHCGAGCSGCEDIHCEDCLQPCGHCDSGFCSCCLSHCTDCDGSFCRACLTEERCPDCHEAHEENSERKNHDAENTDDATSPIAADAAVQSLCLGEADLSARCG